MSNIQSVAYLIFSKMKYLILFLLQLFVITLLLYNVFFVAIDNYEIKNQFINFDINNSYVINMNTDYFEQNMKQSIDSEKLKKSMEKYIYTSSFPVTFDYQKIQIDGVLTHNMDMYNHKYIESKTPSEGKINLIVGSEYQNDVNVGDNINLNLWYYGQLININAQVSGILDENQYVFDDGNGIKSTDDKIFIEYEELYPYVDNDLKSIYLQDMLRTSVIKGNSTIKKTDFEQNIIHTLEEMNLHYEIKLLLEAQENVFLILKNRYDVVLLQLIMVGLVSVAVMTNYLKNLYDIRKKYYTVLILYGKNIKDIILQLIMEITFYMLLNCLTTYIYLSHLENFNGLLFIWIILVEYLICIIPISLIIKLDKKIVKFIKGVK